MLRSIKLAGVLAAIVAIISIGAFFYLTREIAAPSQNVQASVEQMEVSSETSGQTVFRISQESSQAEYNIFEVLNGSDKTVVGTTDQVAGDILVDLSNPSQSEVGEIVINARTFATDDSRRDNSVARFVLQSESSANEFITFQPSSITGLSTEAINVGDSVEFQITGNLTIAGTTKETTFTVTATLETAEKLVGHAETTILRSDFNLSIPNVPFVAGVEDQVVLKLNFVASAVA